MDDGVIHAHRVESELGTQQRNYLKLCHQLIRVSQGNVARRLAPVHGDIAHVNLQVEGNNVEASYFRAPTRDSLHFGDQPAADIALKGCCGDVPEAAEEQDDGGPASDQQVPPPASRRGGGSVHCVCTPSGEKGFAPGTMTLLSERRVWSQETRSWLTFSWMSSSRICPDTSAKATPLEPDCFN